MPARERLESTPAPRSLRDQVRTAVIQRAPVGNIHKTLSWDYDAAKAVSNILLASLSDERFSTTIASKLIQKPGPEFDVRLAKVADIYEESLKRADTLSADSKIRLAKAAASLPFDDMYQVSSLQVVAGLADAYGEEVPDIPFRFDPLAFLELYFPPHELEKRLFGNLIRASRYYEDPLMTTAYVVNEIADWFADPDKGRTVDERINDKDIYAVDYYLTDVLAVLSDKPELQQAFVQKIIRDNVPLGSMLEYIKKGFNNASSDAERLYQQLSNLRPDMVIVDPANIISVRGQYFAKRGELESAEDLARNADYEDYCNIMLAVSNKQYQNGNKKEALATLDEVYAKDPGEDFRPVHHPTQGTIGISDSRRRKIMEQIAETYLFMGSIPQAIKAFTEVAYYSAPAMGKIVVEQGMVMEYMTSLATDENISLEIKAKLAIECLHHVNRVWGMNPEKRDELMHLYELVNPLINALVEKVKFGQGMNQFTSSDIQTEALLLLSQSGRIDEVLEIIETSRDFHRQPKDRRKGWDLDFERSEEYLEEAIFTAAHRGDLKKAWEIAKKYDGNLLLMSSVMDILLVHALFQRDYDIFQSVLDATDEQEHSGKLFNIYKQYGESLGVVPDWILEKFFYDLQSEDEFTYPLYYYGKFAWKE